MSCALAAGPFATCWTDGGVEARTASRWLRDERQNLSAKCCVTDRTFSTSVARRRTEEDPDRFSPCLRLPPSLLESRASENWPLNRASSRSRAARSHEEYNTTNYSIYTCAPLSTRPVDSRREGGLTNLKRDETYEVPRGLTCTVSDEHASYASYEH